MADGQRPSDFDIMSHSEEVMRESIKDQPFVSEREPIAALVQEFETASEAFRRKTQVSPSSPSSSPSPSPKPSLSLSPSPKPSPSPSPKPSPSPSPSPKPSLGF